MNEETASQSDVLPVARKPAAPKSPITFATPQTYLVNLGKMPISMSIVMSKHQADKWVRQGSSDLSVEAIEKAMRLVERMKSVILCPGFLMPKNKSELIVESVSRLVFAGRLPGNVFHYLLRRNARPGYDAVYPVPFDAVARGKTENFTASVKNIYVTVHVDKRIVTRQLAAFEKIRINEPDKAKAITARATHLVQDYCEHSRVQWGWEEGTYTTVLSDMFLGVDRAQVLKVFNLVAWLVNYNEYKGDNMICRNVFSPEGDALVSNYYIGCPEA